MNKYENEKLKYICDTIGYAWLLQQWWRDAREIIFAQEFMDKYEKYLYHKPINYLSFKRDILKNLDNPVDYLFNMIWWKQTQ